MRVALGVTPALLAWLLSSAPAFAVQPGTAEPDPAEVGGIPRQAPSLTATLHALHEGNPENAARDIMRIRATGGIGSPEAHFLAGRAWLIAGKPEFAVLPLRQASRTYDLLQDYALFHLGEAYLLLERSPSAITAFERLLVDFPESVLTARARLKLADAYEQDRQFDRAYDLYLRVISKGGSGTPKHDLLLRAAGCLEALGRKEDAAKTYFSVWRDFPRSASAGNAGTKLDEFAAAKVVVASRTATDTRYLRALALASSGGHSEALAEIDALVAAKAALPGDWRLKRAQILFDKRDYTGSRDAYARLASSSPAGALQAEAIYWHGRSYGRLGEYDRASAIYDQLRKKYPRSSWARKALYLQGIMALEHKHLARAVAYFERYGNEYRSANDADEALWYEAWSRYRMADYAGAEAAFNKLRSRHPRSSLVPRAKYWTARGQLHVGNRERAIAGFSALALEQSLTYYGMLAQGALAEAGASVSLVPDLADEIDPDPPADGDEAPDAETAPEAPPDPIEELLAELATSPASYRFHFVRAHTLTRLGFQTEAALELTAARRAAHSREEKLALARLALEAEFFHGAQYIARVSFGPELGTASATDEIYQLAYPRAFRRFVTTYARQYSYSPSVLWAIMREESTFRPEVVSPVGAIGLLQIMPYTGKEIAHGLGVKGFTPDNLYDPEINIGFSAWYVRRLFERYGGNEALTIASYNAGPDAVDRWLTQRGKLSLDEFVEEIPYSETRRYVKRVLMSYGIYEAVYGAGAPHIRAGKQVEKSPLVGAWTAQAPAPDEDAAATSPSP